MPPADGEQQTTTTTVEVKEGAEAKTAADILKDATPWFGALPETNEDEKAFKGWVENKKFADPAAALKAHRELEKHVGANRVLLPKEGEDITQHEIWDKLGVPKDAKGYADKIKRPTLPDGMTYDEASEQAYLEHAAKVRTPAHIVQQNIDFITQQRVAEHNKLQEHKASEAKALGDLMKEWGADKDQNIEFAKRAAKYCGLAPEETEALEKGLLGGPVVMKALLKLGKHLKEGASVDGDSAPIIGKEAVKAELARLNERIGKGETLTAEELKQRSFFYKQLHG